MAVYQRHRPENTLLYQIVEKYYPLFLLELDRENKVLPDYVKQEFADYLKCGILEHGFIRVKCTDCNKEQLVAFSCKRRGFCPSCGVRRMVEGAALLVDEVIPQVPMRQWVLSFPFQLRFLFASYPELMNKVLALVQRAIASWQIKRAGFTRNTAKTGSVTLIQRFGSALNLNIHFHMLFLDGVYGDDGSGQQIFQDLPAPRVKDLELVLHRIVTRVARFLEHQGVLERDTENSYLQLDCLERDDLQDLHGHSITYRIALGKYKGHKVMTVQTLIPQDNKIRQQQLVATESGFSLHAGVVIRAYARKKLERLCRYIARPALSEERLSITTSNKISYKLKTPHRNGTTHVYFEPLDFMARLASLVPKPKINLTRFHGLFAPNCKSRVQITGQDKSNKKKGELTTRLPSRKSMTWAQRLKRVFKIDIATCASCGGRVKIIGAIEDSLAIKQILEFMRSQEKPEQRRRNLLSPPERAPPAELF